MATPTWPPRESGFEISPPRDSTFRFCESPLYVKLCGRKLKEMDFGWWDEPQKTLFLLELKGNEIWREFEADDPKNNPSEFIVASLKEKFSDCLLMLAAAWVGTQAGKELRQSLPLPARAYPGHGQIKMIFLLDTPAIHRPLLLSVRDKLRGEIEGRRLLWGLRGISVVDYEGVRKMNLPVTRSNQEDHS